MGLQQSFALERFLVEAHHHSSPTFKSLLLVAFYDLHSFTCGFERFLRDSIWKTHAILS